MKPFPFEDAPRVARLPRDKRGFPIPFVVLINADGTPSFVVNDTRKLIATVLDGLCSVCGEPLDPEDVWFVGGPGSGLDPRGQYNDGPMHHECGTFALRVCPYLALRGYAGMQPEHRAAMMERLFDEQAISTDDPTVDPAKPTTFIMGRATGYVVGRNGIHIRYIPNRPFRAIEEWRDGARVEETRPEQPDYEARMRAYRKRGLDSMKRDRMRYGKLYPWQQKAWNNGFDGRFPWRRKDSDIDLSDIPEAGEEWFREAKLVMPEASNPS